MHQDDDTLANSSCGSEGGRWVLSETELTGQPVGRENTVTFELSQMQDLDIWGTEYEKVSFRYEGRERRPSGLSGQLSLDLLRAWRAAGNEPDYPGEPECWFCRRADGYTETALAVKMVRPTVVGYRDVPTRAGGEVEVEILEAQVTVPRCRRCEGLHRRSAKLSKQVGVLFFVGFIVTCLGAVFGVEALSPDVAEASDGSSGIGPEHLPVLALLSVAAAVGLVVLAILLARRYTQVSDEWPARDEERVGTYPTIVELWEQDFRISE